MANDGYPTHQEYHAMIDEQAKAWKSYVHEYGPDAMRRVNEYHFKIDLNSSFALVIANVGALCVPLLLVLDVFNIVDKPFSIYAAAIGMVACGILGLNLAICRVLHEKQANLQALGAMYLQSCVERSETIGDAAKIVYCRALAESLQRDEGFKDPL